MQIKINNLSHTYAPKSPLEFKALSGVSATINQGEFVGIIGETGSGKTTLIEHFNGLLRPTSGEIILVNLTNFERFKEHKRTVLHSKFEEKIERAHAKYNTEEITLEYQIRIDKAVHKSEKHRLTREMNRKIEKIKSDEKKAHKKTEKKVRKLKEKFVKKANEEEKLFKKIQMELDNAKTEKNKENILYKYGMSPVRVIRPGKRKIKHVMQIRSRIGIVFQFAEYQLFEETVQKDIMFGPLNLGTPRLEAKALAAKYLNIVGLPENYLAKSPFELSGGEKRRVAIAGILSMEPDFLIFDEPTAGLDPVGRDEMLNIFQKLNNLGKTIIMVTHNLDEVLAVTKKTILMSNGKIVKFDDTYTVLNDVKFLKDNHMKPPQLLEFTNKLENRGFKVGRVTTLQELATKIRSNMKIAKSTKPKTGRVVK